MKDKKIFPYFQPIIAADTNDIYAFEVLGRYEDDDGSVRSLGPFFTDPNVSCEQALEVDRIVRKQALQQFAEFLKDGGNSYLFINMRLNWVASHADNIQNSPTIRWAKEFGVDLSKLVIEITEEEFFTDDSTVLDTIADTIAEYKDMGCRIAIDDYGKCASDINRLAQFSPDIVKIDMEYVHKCENSYHYREYLKSISSFAERVGIEILYEGIETQTQLDFCISAKGRCYQGFFLNMPQPSLKCANVGEEEFASSFYRVITSFHERIDRINERREMWDSKVDNFFYGKAFNSVSDNTTEYFSKMFMDLSPMIKRIFLCDRWGQQLSYNIEKTPTGVVLNDCRYRNWSWRGYFQEAMLILAAGSKSHMTAVYRDATTKEKIYTYIRAINKDLFLFVDVLQDADLG